MPCNNKMIFIHGPLLSGIGQVVKQYCELVQGTLVDFTDDFTIKVPKNSQAFVFCLPMNYHMEKIKQLQTITHKVIYMTVCETETVHKLYGHLFDTIKQPVAVPSEFCKKVFERQFPQHSFYVLRHHVKVPKEIKFRTAKSNYIFYHIGNISDPRKQCDHIIKAFTELKLTGASLIFKASCLKPVNLSIPGVHVINGLIDDEQLEHIHNGCDCYVSFSCSEGVGMGAVEAAIRNKPVIITEYGGAKEYISTPYTISCTKKPIGFTDFLYEPQMEWGCPDYEQLKEFMRECYNKKLRVMNHDHTRRVVNAEIIKQQLGRSSS